MIHRILLGLDGSAMAEAAIPHAMAVATAFDASVLLLRVLEGGPETGRPPVDSVDWQLGRAEAEAYLHSVAKTIGAAGISVETTVTEGSAAEQIVDVARSRGVDLVVIGSHGEGGRARFDLNGTAHKVVDQVGLSLLLVRSPEMNSPPLEGPVYRRVVVPLDGSHRAEWALCLASFLVRSQGASLLLVSVVPVPEIMMRPPLEDRDQRLMDELRERGRQWAEEYLREMKERLSAPGLNIETRVLVAPQVGRSLHQFVEGEGCLQVVSAHGASDEVFGPYGSVTKKLIDNGRSPLLIFQDQAVPELRVERTEAADDCRLPKSDCEA